MRRVGLLMLALACWLGGVGAVKRWEAAEGQTEYLSVPPAATARWLAVGYDAMAADFLFLNFVFYFGKHLRRDKAYFNLVPVLQLITDLDPRFEGAYALGALALGDNGQVDAGEALWNKGVAANPTRWEYPYQAGMNLFLFGHTPEQYLRAGALFGKAAALPGAPPEARYMQARMYDVSNRRDLATAVWKRTYEIGATPEERAVAARSLKRLGVPLDSQAPQSPHVIEK